MTEPTSEDLVAQARAWIEADPDPATRAELEAAIVGGAAGDLADRMAGRLEFGTAGLRGIDGAGSNRMNRAVVITTSRGLADYLLARPDRDPSAPVIVGFDGRLSSRTFAGDTVGVLAAAGLDVHYFEDPVPTPIVSFAAGALGAAAAVVITASHNPPEYNGYKVYDSNSAQIVPPVDGEIAAAITAVGPATGVPRIEAALTADHDRIHPVPVDILDRYLDAVAAVRRPDAGGPLRVVYTPMHGVGGHAVAAAMERFGYHDFHIVPAQAVPDGRFPTVNFPNPEEPGALDLSFELADAIGADIILANDPDADRLAVAVRRADGEWQPLTGNQIGALLGDYLLESAAAAPQPLAISSIVSSPMLASVATEYGAAYHQTLTGFKWICNAALDLEARGAGAFRFGYEEALGYSVDRIVRDKDGISAAVLFADLAAGCGAAGGTVLGRLSDLYRRHGLWVSVQKSIVRVGSEGRAEIDAAMVRLGAAPPANLAGHRVGGIEDFRTGAASRPRWLPDSNLIILDLGDGSRALMRPSGTEPKLKIYVDLCIALDPGADPAAVEPGALDTARAIAAALANHVGLG